MIKLNGFTRDTILWLAHLRFVGSLAFPPFPAFAKAARTVDCSESWSEFVREYTLSTKGE
jgi:hypothetical protein